MPLKQVFNKKLWKDGGSILTLILPPIKAGKPWHYCILLMTSDSTGNGQVGLSVPVTRSIRSDNQQLTSS